MNIVQFRLAGNIAIRIAILTGCYQRDYERAMSALGTYGEDWCRDIFHESESS